MSQRAADRYLVDVLDAADAVARSLQGVSFDGFVGQSEKRDAVLWNLMIVGEASTKLPADLTAELPEIPWPEIRGFRNRVIHGYFSLQWPIATAEFPRLRDGVEALLAKIYPETHRRWRERLAPG
ncbi:MAG TPA: HepT-like ribonuclease domain-containing protein [Isosphaeraceae bacterium]|nr:HepT-like ribonuclease domain-containing protein [Isosphaeraceae bacterium]